MRILSECFLIHFTVKANSIYRDALRTEVKGLRKSTLLQQTSLVERQTALLKQVQRFREVQRLHMVGFDHHSYADTPSPENVEDFKLYMPSSIPLHSRRKFCQPSLLHAEERIRDAEAHDALEDLRHHLRTRSYANQWKIANVVGQIHNTRARERQATIDDHVRTAATQYRKARAALLALRGHGDWEQELRVLDQSDVRALNERELSTQEKDQIRAIRRRVGIVIEEDIDDERAPVAAAVVGAGQRRPSWIWYNGNNCEDMKDPATRAGEYSLSPKNSLY